MITNVFTKEYKKQASEYVELLFCLVQKGGTCPNDRIIKIASITEDYFEQVGKSMDSSLLDRLTDIILYDDLTNQNPHKMSTDEYPIMSERQEKRRYLREVSDVWATTVATDGKDYRVQTRDSNRRLRNVGL